MYLKALVVGEELTASNGNKYKVVSFQELSQYIELPIGKKEIKSNARPAKRTLWDGQDGLYNDFNVGDITAGEVKTLKVEPYEIGEGDDARTVNTFTGVKFKNESDEIMAKKYGHKLFTEEVAELEVIANKAVVAEPAVVVAEIPV